MNKLTKMALEWRKDGLTDGKIVENVKDELVYDILEQYQIDLSDHHEAKLESLMRNIVDDNINWEELEQLDREGKAWEDARRSAIYG